MRLHKGVIAAASTVLLLVASCSGTGQPAAGGSSGGGSGKYNYKIAVVTHGAAGDTFWDVVKKGAEKAGTDMGDTVTYQDSNGDPTKQSQLIDAAVNEKVDGLVVSMANPDALKASIQKAIAAASPVITMDSGRGKSRSSARARARRAGRDHRGAGRGATAQGGRASHPCAVRDPGSGNMAWSSAARASSRVWAARSTTCRWRTPTRRAQRRRSSRSCGSDPSINGVLTLGPVIGAVAIEAVSREPTGRPSWRRSTLTPTSPQRSPTARCCSPSTGRNELHAQGYLPIVMLTLYKSNLDAVGGGQPVLAADPATSRKTTPPGPSLSTAGTR